MIEEPENIVTDDRPWEGWVVLELMGHRRLAGYLHEQQIAGTAFMRIVIPSDPPVTQLYSPAAVYAITPTTEETARKVAALTRVAPVQHWGLPALPQRSDDADPEETPW